MGWIREYRLELLWLLLLIVLFASHPSSSRANGWNWDDGESDCGDGDFYCIPAQD